jgi:hypothetical protein
MSIYWRSFCWVSIICLSLTTCHSINSLFAESHLSVSHSTPYISFVCVFLQHVIRLCVILLRVILLYVILFTVIFQYVFLLTVILQYVILSTVILQYVILLTVILHYVILLASILHYVILMTLILPSVVLSSVAVPTAVIVQFDSQLFARSFCADPPPTTNDGVDYNGRWERRRQLVIVASFVSWLQSGACSVKHFTVVIRSLQPHSA